jgi:mannose-6-phosphate isomerase-like protein (cupin superfamily)
MSHVVRTHEGIRFEIDEDCARILVSAADTNGRYPLMEWTLAAGPVSTNGESRDYGAHLHRECEETFLIRSGSLEFLLDGEVTIFREGDFVRVPAGTLHGYQNVSGGPVEMLVGFTPAGLETLFLKYRTDQPAVPAEGFVAEATRSFASEFGLAFP